MNSLKLLKTSLLITLALSCMLGNSFAATLTSIVDRNQIGAGETLQLRVSYDEDMDSSQLNFDALQRDFQILSVSPQSNSSISVQNGKTSRVASTVWAIVLAPKRSGRLTIPRFTLAGNRSEPITIMVQKPASTGAVVNPDQPMMVSIKTDRKTVYPDQQFIVEVAISVQNNVSNLNGPQLIVKDAEVIQLGQETFQKIDNGIIRQVVVLKYAVFAQQAGKLDIPVMQYTGVRGGNRSIFSSRGQQVFARSKQLTIKVKNKPDAQVDNAPWFPAENVVISSEWSRDTSSLNVGEPLTRTISITAVGQRASLVPPLVKPISPQNYKLYQDQAQLDSKPTKKGIISTRIESEALVPSRLGELKIPEVKLPWWNVRTKKWSIATLPAETLTVSGAANLGSVEHDQGSPLDVKITPAETSFFSDQRLRIWQLICALLAALCLIQLWWISKLKRQTTNNEPMQNLHAEQVVLNEKQSWKQLQKSFAGGDHSLVRKELLSWAQSALASKEHVTLNALASQISDLELQDKIRQFDHHLYSNSSDFDLNEFKKSTAKIRAILLKRRTKKPSQKLGSLYS